MSYTTTATATSGVGSYAVTGSGLTANNYTLVQAVGNTTALTITPAALTVSADAKSMTYGGNALPGLTYTSSGLVNGDAVSGALSTTATAYDGSTPGSASNVGTYPIAQGSLSAGNNYTISYTGANLTVNPATLSYVAANATSVYGQTPSVNAGTLSGLVNGDTQASATTGSMSYTTTATATSGVGSYAVTGSGLTANNYTLVQAVGNTTALTITPATLTVAADAQSMTYGGVLPALTYTSSGFVNNETAALFSGALSTTATAYNGTTAGSGSSVGTYPIAQGSLSAGNNYTISYTGANLTVNKAQLTATGNSPSMTYGANSLPALSVSYSGYLNGDTSAAGLSGSPTVSTTATPYSGTAGSASLVGTYAVATSVAGMTSTNYTFVAANGTLTVNQAPITVSGLLVNGKTYDGSTTAVVDVSGATYTGLIAGDIVSVSVTGANFASANAGTHAVSLTSTKTGAQAGNYTVSAPGSLTGTITPATLTVAADAQSMTYGANALPALTYTSAGFVNNETAALFSGALSTTATPYNGTAGSGSNAGSYPIAQGTLTAGSNYTINYTGANLTVNPATLSYVAANATSVYGQTPSVNAGTLSGLVNGDTQASATTGSMSYTTTATATSGVGSYAVTGSGLTANNYTLVQAVGNTTALTITPAALTVSADAKSMTYGDSVLPNLTYIASGLVNGDAVSGALSTSATAYIGTAGSASNVGTYPIAQGSLSAGNNYTISYTGANLTVNPATLSYVAANATSVYGQTPSVNAGTLSGLVNGDTQASATTGSMSYTTTATATSGVGSYAVTGSGLTANNYTLVQAGGNTTALTITPAPLTVSADAKSMTYGDSVLPNLTYIASGLVNGDAVSGALSTSATAYNGTAGSASNVGTYPIAQGSLSAGNNYTISYTGANLTVNPATLTYVAGSASSVYGQTPSVNAGTLSGLVNGDTQAGATTGSMSYTTTATATSGVGSYAVTGSGLTANNYTLVQAGGNTTALTITPAPLTVSADAKSMTYGDSVLPNLTYIASGLVNGDAVSGALSTSATAYSGTAGSGSNVGTYPIAQGSLSAGNNYTISYTGANLTVNPATLTYVAGSASSVYGQTPSVNAGTLSGLVNGDTQASATTGSMSYTTTATATSGVGSYAVTGSGLTANNYTLVQAVGNTTALTITPAALTVSADAKSMTYGDSVLPNLTYIASGLVNGDAVSGALSTSATAYNGTAGSASNVGTYPIAQGSLSAGNNYTISYTGANLTVNPATLSYVAANATSVYGQTPSVNAGTLSGLVNGDTQASATTGSMSYTTTATATSGVGSYAVTGSGLTANNYTLVQAVGNSTALTITPAPLTVSADAKSMTYGGNALPGLTYTSSGLVNGDAVSGALSTSATAYNGTAGSASNVGTYPIAQGSLSAGNNYTISYTGGNMTVLPAILTVQANDQVKTYDGLGHTAGVTISGFVAGQDARVISGTLNLGGVSNSDGMTTYNQEVRSGSYDVTPAGLSAANYSMNFVTGLLSIDPAALTVSARNTTKMQDNVPFRGGSGVDFVGFVSGESQSDLSGSLIYSGSSQNATRAGTYSIVPGGMTSTDYVISYVNGSLLIKPKPVTTNVAATTTVSATQTQQAVSVSSATALSTATTSATASATTPAATTASTTSTTTTAPRVAVVPVPLVPVTLTNTKSALDLGAFKVVGTTAPGVLDVVFVPNPSIPQNVIPVLQLPLATGQGPVPEKIINDLYLSAGVVTASATTAVPGTSTAGGTAGTTAAAGTASTLGTTPTAGTAGTSVTTGNGAATATTTTTSTTVASGSATNSTSTSTTDDEKKNNVRVEQSQITTVLANDAPLPTQLTFNPEDKSFTLAKGADVKLPLQVKIQLRQGGSVVSEKLVMLASESLGP
jgi:hypothetical protein